MGSQLWDPNRDRAIVWDPKAMMNTIGIEPSHDSAFYWDLIVFNKPSVHSYR